MADLRTRFETAVTASKALTQRPDNATLLRLYGLYKQATVGDNNDKKPGFADLVGRAKWEAWNGVKGVSNEQAMQQYIALMDSLG